jgi:hypothetical protein
VQHGVGVDLEHARGGTDAQAFGQAGQDAHDQFNGRLFTVEERAMSI